MATKYRHSADFGSSIAKGGFRNEHDVVNKFNSWKSDEQAQLCLLEMGYSLDDIEKVEAFMIRDIIKESQVTEKYNPKSDIQVQITIFLKNLPDPQNVSVKLVSTGSGFNQIDKRWVDRYAILWGLPNGIIETLKRFTGELPPVDYGKGCKEKRRMYLDEMSDPKIKELIDFFEDNKITIISDLLKGRGAFSAQWMLVVWNIPNEDSIWVFKSINEVINHYSKGNVSISSKGSLHVAKLTVQRKGGDGGRETAKMLQFKFNPLDLLKII